jgi:nucleotide-binding universal stress UspA family protein
MTSSASEESSAVDRDRPARAVVVGMDGSGQKRASLAWAIHQAVGTGRPLTLLHVLNDYSVPVPHHSMTYDDERRPQVLELVRSEVIADHPGLTVHVVSATGDTVSRLLDRSAGQGLLVLGSRGLGAVRRLVVGSTSIAAAGRSSVPVVVVPDAWRQADHSDEPIIVGLDPQRIHEKALRFAFAHAQRRGVAAHLVHAMKGEPALVWDPSMRDDDDGRAKAHQADRIDAAALPFRDEFPDVPVRHSELWGSAAKVLASVGSHAQLIVVGRDHAGHAGFPLSSVTRVLLHHSDVPVAVVPTS